MTDISPAIACTLDPDQMPRRANEIRALGRDGLEAVERGERRVTLRFRPDPSIRARVDAIVTAESKCCAFLDFAVAGAGDATVLTIAAPEGAEPALRELTGLFADGRY
ncbi:MAG TPA: hypothetical protein VFY52_05345 [Thermoleophilaceae bacterium]|nr:hypothetical protein [Thermoleophilaceae bacterium]